LPLASRLFDGDNLVRGFRRGGLGPYILVRQAKPDGTTEVRGDLSGANLVVAANAEYRVPLEAHTEVAAFADGGTGWLLPHWLGGPRPEILEGTNGILRSSAGIEVRVRLPVLNQTVRVYYAANPLRFARAIMLPGGVAVRPDEGRQTLGWGLGTFF
jgi:outer membrane protein assembly factor BamA